MSDSQFVVRPVGFIRSAIKRRKEAPKQGREGAPDAWIDVHPTFADALEGIGVGDKIIVITWLHLADRARLKVHPRSDRAKPMVGVFDTRSPDRPNPLGLHRVKVLEIGPKRLRVAPLEAIDGTPVVDIKPVLEGWVDH